MLRSRSKDATAARSQTPTASLMSDEQLGQNISVPFALPRSSFGRHASHFQDRQKRQSDSPQDFAATYLHELRHNRPSRPGGARPLPGGNQSYGSRMSRIEREVPVRAESAMAGTFRSVPDAVTEQPDRAASAMSHRGMESNTQKHNTVGRPLAREPVAPPGSTRNFSRLTNASKDTSSSGGSGRPSCEMPYKYPYYERGQRWMERQETNSLSRALYDMDLKQEQRLHSAAQEEAAELVWKHRNPDAPYENPDSGYRSHLRKGSHARSQSVGPFQDPDLFIRKGGSADGSRSASDSSNRSQDSRKVSSGSSGSYGSKSSREDEATGTVIRRGRQLTDSMRERAMAGLPLAISKVRSLSRRRRSENSRKTSDKSNKSLFQNPNDQIWEEPESGRESMEAQPKQGEMPLRDRPRNTSYGTVVQKPAVSNGKPIGPRPSIFEIHKNPPSQSRNAAYTRNEHARAQTPEKERSVERLVSGEKIEVRGDDIRAATSMRRKDRSPNLPTPTIVSDRPGRPIVSFNQGYKAREIPMKEERSRISRQSSESPSIPTIEIAEAPTIQVNSVPSISVSEEDKPAVPSIPVISVGEDKPSRPLPAAKNYRGGSQVQQDPFMGQISSRSNGHWSLASWPARVQAQCANCALGISGKVVTAAGQRYHPECFTCFHCGEHLECVAFYPEPDSFRAERLARIEARSQGISLPDLQAHFTEEEDGDAGLRFYCHLDFHEKFSPRCRSCKTPIEGKVIVACGGEWHEGHFFCAECGDPFDQSTPFVEKNGYAWCVGCHTKRFSGKCAGCRKPIVDTVINALDREWHEQCFTCNECGGQFEDGRFFTREEGGMPVCVRCEERRLKA